MKQLCLGLLFVLSGCATTGASKVLLNTPFRISAEMQGSGAIVAKGWSEAGSSLLGYNLYASETSGGPYQKVNREPINRQQFVVNGVRKGAKLFFVLTAVQGGERETEPAPEWSVVAE